MANSFSAREKRALTMVRRLKELFPKASIVLRFKNNWELLVSVILSAQCTDKKVNEVTRKLFQKYKTLGDYIRAGSSKRRTQEFEVDIRPCGFFRVKTKNILAAARMIQEKFGGKIPKTMDEMLTIPGVARKTANVVLGNAHGIVEGIAVDTHVKRLSQKLGLTKYQDPNKIEQDLMRLLPKKEWFDFTYRIIEYGRRICPARKHDCIKHPLTKLYPKAATLWP